MSTEGKLSLGSKPSSPHGPHHFPNASDCNRRPLSGASGRLLHCVSTRVEKPSAPQPRPPSLCSPRGLMLDERARDHGGDRSPPHVTKGYEAVRTEVPGATPWWAGDALWAPAAPAGRGGLPSKARCWHRAYRVLKVIFSRVRRWASTLHSVCLVFSSACEDLSLRLPGVQLRTISHAHDLKGRCPPHCKSATSSSPRACLSS